MDSTTLPTFKEVADELGMRPKLLYSLKDVAQVTGLSYYALLDEAKAGRLRTVNAAEMKGRFVRADWVDKWIEEGANNAR